MSYITVHEEVPKTFFEAGQRARVHDMWGQGVPHARAQDGEGAPAAVCVSERYV